MKRTRNFLLLMFLALLLTTCQKTDDGSYTAPITITESLNGTWKLSALKQVDELAKANSIKPDEMDIKAKFGFTDMALTLNVNTDSIPTSYEVTGGVPELFPSSGYWDLDSPFTHSDGTPVELILYSDESKTQISDALKITALVLNKKIPELELKLTRESAGTAYVSYVYRFKFVQ